MQEYFKNKFKKFDIFSIIYIFLFIILNLIFYHDNLSLISILLNPFKINIIFFNLLFFVLNIAIFVYVIFRIFVILMKRSNKKYEKIDIKYIRDYLTIPPTTMSYILNLDLNIKTDIVAELLSLEMDGYVKRENNKFIATDKQISYLPESDIYLIKNLNNIINGSYFKKLVEKELIENGYIKEKKDFIIKRVAMFFSLLLISFIFLFIGNKINNDIISYLSLSFIFLTTFWFFGCCLIYTIINNYRRTKKSKDLLPKIIGLGEFLKEFTNINDSKLDELCLKSYYLVYSLIYNLNNDLVNTVDININ